MKVALCFYGQPRLINNSYTHTSHYNWIINKYNVDVYAHSWINDNPIKFSYSDWGIKAGLEVVQLDNTESILLDNYKPKKYLFEPPKTFRLDELSREKVKNLFCYSLNNEYNLMSHIYSMSKSIELIDSYYDWVIISRYDNYIEEFPDLNKLDNTNLYLSDRYSRFCDIIIFGGQQYINSLNCYKYFSELCDKVNTFTAEDFKKEAYKKYFTQEEKRVKIEVGLVRDLSLEKLQK